MSIVGMLLFMLATTAMAAEPIQDISKDRPDTLLNQGWEYFETAARGPGGLSGSNAETVDLPHSWNSLDATDAEPGYRRDAGWYRKLLTLSGSDPQHRYALYFEGANMKADVYVNGQRAGGHIGGYLGFEVEVSDLLDFRGVNEILVRVDNSIDRDLIPSQKADFVLYGGLTRDVFLRIRPPTHIDSVQIDTPGVTSRSANVVTTVNISQTEDQVRSYLLDLDVLDSDQNNIVNSRSEIQIDGGTNGHTLELPAIDAPQLWSPDAPNLYTLKVTLRDENGAVVHEQIETFGLRWFSFADDGSFMLNGERLLLRGTHRHEEHAGLGAAMPNELHIRDMEMIKEVGANFVRLGHYPQDPSVYRAADRLGLIIWDELPWCRGGMGGDDWKRNTETMLREMITQNRNHPSVFFWSLGNEIYWLPDFEGGDDEKAMNDYLRHLNDIAHEMDPSRMTAIRKYYAGWDIVDVFSPSIWAGWYGGGYFQYEEALGDAQQKYPRFLHMEYGGSSHVGRNSWNPPGGEGMRGGQVSVAEMVNQAGVVSVAKAGDWSESYITDLFDWHLKVSESQPGFAGNAQWAFKDFATPLRAENPIPYINQKGLVDREGRPKEAYWVFKSHWTTDPAFCHIFGHSWTERQGEPDSSQQIRVYCNTDSAQLPLNGVALEEKQRKPGAFPASGLFWDVRLQEGDNRLSVTGSNAGREVAQDRLDLRFTTEEYGAPANIQLQASPADGGRVLIEAVVVDNNGRQVHSDRERIYFSHTNPGTGGHLVKDHGTPDKSAVIEAANGRAAILFEPAGQGHGAVIEARTQNLKGSYIELPGPDTLKGAEYE